MNESFDVAVCIGRFQLYHHGQAAVLRRALDLAPRVVVVIGSAHQARTPRNPFTWGERAEMIRLSLTPAEAARVQFAPVRDYYDETRWAAAVREAVAASGADRSTRVALVGHRKDATSEYLAGFPDWRLVDIGHQGDLHAKALRAALFTTDHLPAALAAIAGQVPPTTVEFLRAWAELPCFAPLREEWRALARERALWDTAPYPPVFVTVDAVVRKAGHVLLIRRGRAPGRGLLALPGGFLEQRETVYQSALRELEEETGLRLLPSTMQAALRAVRVFDHPDRSQRGRVITHAHLFDLGDGPLPEVRGSDDASEATWVPVTDVASLEAQFHDDHFSILQAMVGG
ncbi:bifunctional nicotinamide-nucleotide adenylyltransferase/Nudix hydroxylase [Ramlibacter sp.]|uniref:bifunctional nicotinamide-nucleotide adenylyltransferase/Nudix hydroxylase n=1 Tax=Ramlibacter sp. TaxID=1917967 RepID=UPI0035AF531F